MGSVKKINHKEKEIVYFDLRNCKEEELLELLAQGKSIILRSRQKILRLTNFTGSYAAPKFIEHVNKFGKAVKYRTSKTATAGITGAKIVLFKTYNSAAGGIMQLFETEEEAKEWLIQTIVL